MMDKQIKAVMARIRNDRQATPERLNFQGIYCGNRTDVLGNKNIKLEGKRGQGNLIKKLSAY